MYNISISKADYFGRTNQLFHTRNIHINSIQKYILKFCIIGMHYRSKIFIDKFRVDQIEENLYISLYSDDSRDYSFILAFPLPNEVYRYVYTIQFIRKIFSDII